MSHRRLRFILMGALTALLLGVAAVFAFAATTGFTIQSITPSSFNPSAGQSTTISYSLLTRCKYSISVLNSSGATVCTLVTHPYASPGGFTLPWNGQNSSGAVVPSGTYTVLIQGKTLQGAALANATGTVTVTGTTTKSPSAFTITSVSPNPLNPTSGSATITYTVPATATGTVTVTSSTGSAVCTLATFTSQAAGTYTTTWNGKNSSGTVVANGTYTISVSGTLSGSTTAITTATTTLAVTTPATTQTFGITSVSPNPLNPTSGSATITYTVPATATGTVTVTTSTGTAVATLATFTSQAAGTYTTTWNGKNSSGTVVANGTYTVSVSGTLSGSTTVITTATATLTVSATQTFGITSVSPNPLNPTSGSATITYTVPATATGTVTVTTSTGTAVITLATFTSQAAGTYTTTWTGKNTSGTVVANGTYTITVSGTLSGSTTAITSATATETVTSSSSTGGGGSASAPPAGTDLGQTVGGAGSANFNWFQYYSTEKFGIMFIAPKSGTIKDMTLEWKETGGYGGGNHGTYTFELQSNGTGNFPSGTVLANATGIVPSTHIASGGDGPLTFPISATLTAGTIYHLVIYDTDPDYSVNWSSPNSLCSQILPWDGTVGNRGEAYTNGVWAPWTSTSNIWNTSGGNSVNGAHCPTMLTWSDGSTTGDPYYSSLVSGGAYMYNTNRAGEFITWNNPTTTISQIGSCIGKVGSPAGALIYHLDNGSTGASLATGTLETAAQVGTVPNWAYVMLPAPVTLTQGQTYRLWFESPSSTSSSNCYFQYIPYGTNDPTGTWLADGWGGASSYYTFSTSGTTSSSSSWSNDGEGFSFTFSMH